MPQPTPNDLTTAHRLWSFLQPPNDREYLRYFAKHATKRVQGGTIAGPEHLARLMAGFRASGHDAYIQLNPSTTTAGLRPTKAEVARHSLLLYDVDPLQYDEGMIWPMLDWKKPYDNMPPGAAIPVTMACVFSGRGIQYWARATQLRMDTPEQRRQAEWYNRRILDSLEVLSEDWRIDVLPDLTRLARMPNTINSKTGREAYLIDNTTGYMFGVDWDACMEWAGPPPVYEPPIIEASGKWQLALSGLSLKAKTFILEGAESGARHHDAYAAAAALRDAAIPQESALTAVLRGARLSRPPLDSDNSFTTKEVERIVRRVYGN